MKSTLSIPLKMVFVEKNENQNIRMPKTMKSSNFFEALKNKTFKKIYGFKNLESDEKNANKCEMIRRRSRFFSLHRSKFDPNSRLSAATDSVHRYRKNRVKFIDRAFLNHLLKFYIKNFNSRLSFFCTIITLEFDYFHSFDIKSGCCRFALIAGPERGPLEHYTINLNSSFKAIETF